MKKNNFNLINNNSTIAYVCGISASTLWATHVLIGWYFANQISPVEFLFWRWSIAALFMIIVFWSKVRADIFVMWQSAPKLLLLAIFGSVGSNGLGYWALHHTSSLNVAIISSSMPVMVFGLQIFLKDKQANYFSILGVLLSTFGVFTVISQGNVNFIISFNFGKGETLAIMSNLSWAIYSVFAPRMRPAVGQISFTLGIAVCASLLCAPLLILQGISNSLMDVSFENIAAVAYAGIAVSVFGYLFYNTALTKLGAKAASLFMHLIPFVAALLTAIFLNTYPTAYQIVGLITILIGVIIVMYAEGKNA